jgi:hypothetical protein
MQYHAPTYNIKGKTEKQTLNKNLCIAVAGIVVIVPLPAHINKESRVFKNLIFAGAGFGCCLGRCELAMKVSSIWCFCSRLVCVNPLFIL